MDFSDAISKRTHNYMMNGDLVIVYERHDQLDHIYLEKGQIFQNKHGAFFHDDFINRQFGTKIVARSSKGWVYALRPTPELWGLAVHSRTQIVDEVDSSIVVSKLGLKPGCIVVESGTGSGCMSTCLARAVNVGGHVYSYEYNPQRAVEATEEFKRLGLADLITVQCRDVCGKTGSGGFLGVAESSVDAVFLDLPEPWLAIPHALQVLKGSRPVCSYSPCIGQVEKTCAALRESGFHSITMIEVRRRPFDGRSISVEIPLLRPLEPLPMDLESNPPRDTDECHSSNLTNSKGGIVDNTPHRKKRKLDNASNADNLCSAGSDSDVQDEGTMNKEESALVDHNNGEAIGSDSRRRFGHLNPVLGRRIISVARPDMQMKGHTAFLTFAVAPFKPRQPINDSLCVVNETPI